jgi:hypothetical protein
MMFLISCFYLNTIKNSFYLNTILKSPGCIGSGQIEDVLELKMLALVQAITVVKYELTSNDINKYGFLNCLHALKIQIYHVFWRFYEA